MLACLPPMPYTDDEAACTEDLPSGPHYSLSFLVPTDPLTERMTDDDAFAFSSEGNITEIWSQSTTHYPEIS